MFTVMLRQFEAYGREQPVSQHTLWGGLETAGVAEGSQGQAGAGAPPKAEQPRRGAGRRQGSRQAEPLSWGVCCHFEDLEARTWWEGGEL